MLRTENEEWGFYGTARQQNGEGFAEKAWKVAFEHVTEFMAWDERMTLHFLDSKCGRHYADVMEGGGNWRDKLTQYCHLESECRGFFEKTNPLGYRIWSKANGRNPTERVLLHAKISTDDIVATVRALTALDYTKNQIEQAIYAAGPVAQALALILADIPEEIRCMYTGEDW